MTHLHVAHYKKPAAGVSRASARAGEVECRHKTIVYHRHCGRSAESLWGNCRDGHVPAQDLDDFKESFLKTPIQ